MYSNVTIKLFFYQHLASTLGFSSWTEHYPYITSPSHTGVVLFNTDMSDNTEHLKHLFFFLQFLMLSLVLQNSIWTKVMIIPFSHKNWKLITHGMHKQSILQTFGDFTLIRRTLSSLLNIIFANIKFEALKTIKFVSINIFLGSKENCWKMPHDFSWIILYLKLKMKKLFPQTFWDLW